MQKFLLLCILLLSPGFMIVYAGSEGVLQAKASVTQPVASQALTQAQQIPSTEPGEQLKQTEQPANSVGRRVSGPMDSGSVLLFRLTNNSIYLGSQLGRSIC
jgi:hypothetical protein